MLLPTVRRRSSTACASIAGTLARAKAAAAVSLLKKVSAIMGSRFSHTEWAALNRQFVLVATASIDFVVPRMLMTSGAGAGTGAGAGSATGVTTGTGAGLAATVTGRGLRGAGRTGARPSPSAGALLLR